MRRAPLPLPFCLLPPAAARAHTGIGAHDAHRWRRVSCIRSVPTT